MTDARAPAIEDYAVIGDCRTAALISRGGSIDWLCVPRFDSPSVFGALLDPGAGRFVVRPTTPFETTRRYLPDTNVLETTFRCDTGTVRLTDAMTVPARPEGSQGLIPGHEILRRVECVDGWVEIEVLCEPRFEYGRRAARCTDMGAAGLLFDDDGTEALVLMTDVEMKPVAGGDDGCGGSDSGGGSDAGGSSNAGGSPSRWVGRARLTAGAVRYVSLTTEHAGPVTVTPLGEAADRRLAATAGWWREWLSDCAYEGDYGALVRRSMLVLKLLAFPPSGAILAAVTTSLPESPGGARNWDYRYCWLRDASMTLEVLLHLGFVHEGESFLAWLLHTTRLTRPKLQVLYDVYGRTPVREKELDHLAGYRGARPVRIGNGAVHQVQHDIYGELLRAARSFVEAGGRLDRAEARLLAEVGETVCSQWREPDQGIWEVRNPMRQWTYSKAMCWVALDCLLALHDQNALPLRRSRDAIEAEMRAIREAIDQHGWSEDRNSYVAWFDGEEADAATLILGLAGYEDPDSHRMRGTLAFVEAQLAEDGLIRRYTFDDGQPGREGAFGICGFWRAELLARQGRLDEASTAFERACADANDVGLFAEQIDPQTGGMLGNFPQAFTHIGLASAAKEIARARGRPSREAARSPGNTEAVRQP